MGVLEHLEPVQRPVAVGRGLGHGEEPFAIHHEDQAVGDQVRSSLELVGAAVPELVPVKVDAGQLLPSRIRAHAVKMPLEEDRGVVLGLEPPGIETEQGLGGQPAVFLIQLEHQTAGFVSAGEEDPSVTHTHRHGDGGHRADPIGRLPEDRAVVGRDAGHSPRAAIDVHPAAAIVHRSDRRVGHLPVVELRTLPYHLARAQIDRHQKRITRGRQDHSPLVHQRTLPRMPIRHGCLILAYQIQQPEAPAGLRVPAGGVRAGTDRHDAALGHRGHRARHAVPFTYDDRIAIAPDLLAVVQGEASQRVGFVLDVVVQQVHASRPHRGTGVSRAQLQ